ncbi:MAG: DUF1788 domain-containing protein [Coriobacteriia bacterium]|nr:DUF1788 domain-containing protein [Coriobacteriia bacterium]
MNNLGTPSQDLASDFDRIRSRFCDDDFLHNRGLGNEVGFFVYPYDAARELEVRDRMAALVRESEAGQLPCRVVYRDLWDVFESICEERRILDRIPDLEARRGTGALLARLQKIATPEAFARALDYGEREPGRDVLVIGGVGKVYPIVRAHAILENAQHVFEDIPVIMLYPGRYDGRQLHLFGNLSDGNYYRAFSLL